MPKYVVVAALLIAVATPALAAEFYLVQDPKTKKCNIVSEKPDGQDHDHDRDGILCHQGRCEGREEEFRRVHKKVRS